MALIYRSVLEDGRIHLIRAAESTAKRWFKKKGIDLSHVDDGIYEGDTIHPYFKNEYHYRVVIAHAQVSEISAFQLRVFEASSTLGHDVITQFTTMTQGEAGGIHWIDVERVADDPFALFDFKVPSLVGDLIRNGRDVRVGQIRLETSAKVIPVEGLAGLIRSRQRSLPLAVFAHDRAGREVTLERANFAHERLRGIAQVYVLRATDVDVFRDLVGEELGVWGGGARLYMPNWGPDGLRPERHRFMPGSAAARSPRAAADFFFRVLASAVAATPEPTLYAMVKRPLRAIEGETEAEQFYESAAREIELLQRELRRTRDEKDFEQTQNEELNRELNEKSSALERMRRSFALMQSGSANVNDVDEVVLPSSVSSMWEAILWAQELGGLVVHPDAPRDIDELEITDQRASWAQQTWRGLRALDSYAKSHQTGDGGFW